MEIDAALVRKRFPAAAEYVSGIYILARDYGRVSNSRLAAWTGVSGSAVTQALGRLKRLGLARYIRYESIELTEQGRAFARKVLRHHYLLEHLLVRVLDYPWEKADDEAKRLQSEISDDLAEHLYTRLGSPQTCPHGNPMPGSAGEAKLLSAPRLSDAPAGARVRIIRITEEGEQIPRMLDFCHESGIKPGQLSTFWRGRGRLSCSAATDPMAGTPMAAGKPRPRLKSRWKNPCTSVTRRPLLE